MKSAGVIIDAFGDEWIDVSTLDSPYRYVLIEGAKARAVDVVNVEGEYEAETK